MIPPDVLDAAKARLDVPALWQLLALPGMPARSCKCPFHEDRSASFSIFADGRGWKCFAGCGQGDAVAFLQRARNLATGDTLREFVRLAGLDPARPTGRAPVALPAPKPAVTNPRPPAAEWPAMDKRDPSARERLATLRKVAPQAVALAVERGLVAFGEWRNVPAWFVCDRSRRVAQARRLDGAHWWSDGPKALTLPGGSASWPVGLPESAGFPLVALCEGGGDLLAAFHFAWHEDREREVAPVAMLGASQRIHPDALPHFKGRRVRIFPHCDHAGHGAMETWANQLRDAGATVDAFDLTGLCRTGGLPAKDLNDLTQLDAGASGQDRNLWNLFENEPANL